MLPSQLLAAATLLPVTAFALHLNHLLARSLGTDSLMTGGSTFMTTDCSRFGAALTAYLARTLTGALMARLDALMPTAW